MLEKVARRAARGIDQPGWAEQKLADVQTLRAEVEAELERLTGDAATVVDEAVRTAYNRGVATAGADLTKVGVSKALAFGRVNLDTVSALTDSTVTLMRGTHLRVLRTTLDSYRGIIEDTAGQVATGTMTRREASAEALDRFARRGIKGFVDSAGRSWDLASYAEMSVRTTTAQAAVQGHMNRLTELGYDLVIVSDAPEECPLCRDWEGKVLSINGNSSGVLKDGVPIAGTLSEATSAGLFHPNCRHSTGMYTPGLTRPMDDTADPVNAELRVQQRTLERSVRESKREVAAMKAARDQVAREDGVKRLPPSDPFERRYRKRMALLKARQDRLDGFIDEHDRKNLRYRTSLTAR